MSWSSVIPDETDAPLIVDPDRMLTLAIGLQGFEPVAGGTLRSVNTRA
jgi:hypothetical protein